jgi:hypothetical protein
LRRSPNQTGLEAPAAAARFNHKGALLRHKELKMKAFSIVAPLLAVLAGCSYYNTPPVAVAPAYVTPPNTVVLGAPAAPAPAVIVQPSR